MILEILLTASFFFSLRLRGVVVLLLVSSIVHHHRNHDVWWLVVRATTDDDPSIATSPVRTRTISSRLTTEQTSHPTSSLAPSTTPSVSSPPSSWPSNFPTPLCFDDWETLDRHVRRDPSVVTPRTHIICPNTVFHIGFKALLGLPKTTYQCGDDGKAENNCTVQDGIHSLVMGQSAGFSNQFAPDVLVRGLTFDNPTAGAALLDAKGDITFENCIFRVRFSLCPPLPIQSPPPPPLDIIFAISFSLSLISSLSFLFSIVIRCSLDYMIFNRFFILDYIIYSYICYRTFDPPWHPFLQPLTIEKVRMPLALVIPSLLYDFVVVFLNT